MWDAITAKILADLLSQNMWKLQGTLKTIVSYQGNLFILKTTKELDKHLRVWIHPSMLYHTRMDGKSEFVNKVVEQYVHHFAQ